MQCHLGHGSGSRMTGWEIGPEREALGFVPAAEDAFRFLIRDYAYRIVKTETTLLRYESDRLFVNVYRGRGSYELGFELGQHRERPHQPEVFYTLTDILDAAEVLTASGYTLLQASTPERVERLVHELARVVQQHAGPVLRGDYRA